MDKAILIEQCKKGDKAALGLLYSYYSHRMMKLICHYIRNWQAAQDILHDGFLLVETESEKSNYIHKPNNENQFKQIDTFCLKTHPTNNSNPITFVQIKDIKNEVPSKIMSIYESDSINTTKPITSLQYLSSDEEQKDKNGTTINVFPHFSYKNSEILLLNNASTHNTYKFAMSALVSSAIITSKSFGSHNLSLSFNDGEEYKNSHEIPISIGMEFSTSINKKISVSTGMQYSWLSTKRETRTSYQKIKAQYLGMPLKLLINLYAKQNLNVYCSIGAMIEFPTKGKIEENSQFNQFNYSPPVQYSVMPGIGFEYLLNKNIGIFAEPSLNYYFKVKTAYPTIRQDKPLEFTIPIGLRVEF